MYENIRPQAEQAYERRLLLSREKIFCLSMIFNMIQYSV